MTKTSILVLLVGMLSGCGLGGSGTLLQENAQILAAAERAPGTWRTVELLRDQEAKTTEFIVSADHYFLVPVALKVSREALYTAMNQNLLIAAKAMQPEAVEHLYTLRNPFDTELEDLRKTMAETTVATAGEHPSPALAMAAGEILGGGEYVIRDSERAADFFLRAWNGGKVNAPGLAENSFIQIKDYRNAYLWAMRCVGRCEARTSIGLRGLSELQPGLSLEEVREIEKAAADKSIAVLPPKPLAVARKTA